MSGSDYQLSPYTNAIFDCDGEKVSVYFKYKGENVGEVIVYTMKQAAQIGADIEKTGQWDDLPLTLATSDLKMFGRRLKEYGVTGK